MAKKSKKKAAPIIVLEPLSQQVLQAKPNRLSFEYAGTKINDLRVNASTATTGKQTVHSIEINGRGLRPTPRFWTSLFALYGFAPSIFKYYSHAEVFDRVAKVHKDDKVRVVIENGTDANGNPVSKLLGVTKPSKVTIDHDGLLGLMSKQGLNTDMIDYGRGVGGGNPIGNSRRGNMYEPGTPGTVTVTPVGNDGHGGVIDHSVTPNNPTGAMRTMERIAIPQISYHDGIIRTIHRPRNSSPFQIAGDEFMNNFVLDIPIDGYGKPAAYLMLLRMVCTNGAIGFSSAFRSEIAMGKGEDKFDYALTRAIEGFNNEEGYEALRQRFEQAAKSWCSISEVTKIYKMLVKLHAKEELRGVSKKFLSDEESGAEEGVLVCDGSPIIQKYHAMCGDLHRAYGLANLDALGVKRQKTLPSGANMYSMLNFLSELSTHNATPAGQRVIQSSIGDLVSAEYDLEGTVDHYPNWTDFLIRDEKAIESFAIAQAL